MRVARTNRDIIDYALMGTDARTGNGNMSTDSFRVGFSRMAPYRGQLPNVWFGILDDAFSNGRISQVIYSYSTPIAWHDSRYGWIIPNVRYSITTSGKHQTHLWRLPYGRNITLPYDASDIEAQRVLDGLMDYRFNSRSEAVGTIPGPNYVEGE